MMTIRKEKVVDLHERMSQLGIKEEEILERFILGSGSGGQKINKTSSCVYIKHLPSGIEVKCQKERSRELNRYRARQLLCDKIEEEIHHIKSKKQYEIEKIRRQKKRRTRKQKEKMLEEKRQHAEKKQYRQTPKGNNGD